MIEICRDRSANVNRWRDGDGAGATHTSAIGAQQLARDEDHEELLAEFAADGRGSGPLS